LREIEQAKANVGISAFIFGATLGRSANSPARASLPSLLSLGLLITSSTAPLLASETTKATRWVALERVAMPAGRLADTPLYEGSIRAGQAETDARHERVRRPGRLTGRGNERVGVDGVHQRVSWLEAWQDSAGVGRMQEIHSPIHGAETRMLAGIIRTQFRQTR
jgi:hypothetical protein